MNETQIHREAALEATQEMLRNLRLDLMRIIDDCEAHCVEAMGGAEGAATNLHLDYYRENIKAVSDAYMEQLRELLVPQEQTELARERLARARGEVTAISSEVQRLSSAPVLEPEDAAQRERLYRRLGEQEHAEYVEALLALLPQWASFLVVQRLRRPDAPPTELERVFLKRAAASCFFALRLDFQLAAASIVFDEATLESVQENSPWAAEHGRLRLLVQKSAEGPSASRDARKQWLNDQATVWGDELTRIAAHLTALPPSQRDTVLRNRLRQLALRASLCISHRVPPSADVPCVCAGGDATAPSICFPLCSATDAYVQVLRLLDEESFTLSTAGRAPYMLFVEACAQTTDGMTCNIQHITRNRHQQTPCNRHHAADGRPAARTMRTACRRGSLWRHVRAAVWAWVSLR
jgi:hypothetical protein